MYKTMSASKKVEKKLREHMTLRSDISGKLDRLKLKHETQTPTQIAMVV